MKASCKQTLFTVKVNPELDEPLKWTDGWNNNMNGQVTYKLL